MTERTGSLDLVICRGGTPRHRLYSRRDMVRFMAFGGAGFTAAPLLAQSHGLRR